ncbi:MAG: flagellar hook-length control protein FliK [Hyphomonadaceae bacterium]
MDVLAPPPAETAPSPGPSARAGETADEAAFAAHLENEEAEPETAPQRPNPPYTDASSVAHIAALAASVQAADQPVAQPQQQQPAAQPPAAPEQTLTPQPNATPQPQDAAPVAQQALTAPTPAPQTQQTPQQHAAPPPAPAQTPEVAPQTQPVQQAAEAGAPTSTAAAPSAAAPTPADAPAAPQAPQRQQAVPLAREPSLQTAAPRTLDPAAPAPAPEIAAAAAEPAPHLPPHPAQAPKQAQAQSIEPPLRAGRDALLDAAQQPKAAAPAQQNTPQRADAAPAGSAIQTTAPAQTHASAPPPLDLLASASAATTLTTEQARAQEREAARASPSAQVAQQIVRRIENGATRFELRLDPPDLGRVDVRLELSRDHRVTALIAADDAGTLAQLTRAAREIEQTLQAAGLELAENGLTFDLTDQRQAQSRGADQSNTGAGAHDAAARGESEPSALPARRALTLESWRGARVDLVA